MNNSPGDRTEHLNSPSTLTLVCIVAALSYLVPKLEGAMISNPQTVWPLWPGCAILVSVLLLARPKIWPILIPVAFAGFILFDLEAGVAPSSIAWFMLADTVQVLIAAGGLKYFFGGVPRLNSLTAIAKYALVAVILAPFFAAFLSARGIHGEYWNSWRVSFYSEVLAFVTLAPAILNWITEGRSWVRKSRADHAGAVALLVGLVLISHTVLTAVETHSSPALLYSLVPFLLGSALFFGSLGISTSVVIVTGLSIWGAVHGRGPFSHGDPDSIRSLQVFLIFAATPFMVLAALVEDRKLTSRELALANDRLLLAMEAGTAVAWDLDVRSGRDRWFGNLQTIFGIRSDTYLGDAQDFLSYVHPDDKQRVSDSLTDARINGKLYAPEFRVVRPDGAIRWLVARGKFYYAEDDSAERMLGVSMDVTERKLAEEVVKQVEGRYRRIVETTNEGICLLDSTFHVSYVNLQMANMIGYEPGELIGQSVLNFYFAEDVEHKKQVLEGRQQGVSEHLEERLKRKDASELWVRVSTIPLFKDDGQFDGVLAMVADFTDRKLAEDALAAVSRRLIHAQEQERTRIARELHDDIAQRLALVVMTLQHLHVNSHGLSVEARNQTRTLWKQTEELAKDVQSLSHQLHSSKLEYLGLAIAARGFCHDFASQQNVEVDFKTQDLPTSLSKDISLCFFRVLQEALHNSAKHSGTRHFQVRLWATPEDIHLTVGDPGTGFDMEVAKSSRGLGLISMEERLKQLNGTFSIESSEHGTTVHAFAPLRSSSIPLRAAG